MQQNNTIKEEKFRHFDVVTDYTDRHYCEKNSGEENDSFAYPGSQVCKKIMEKWKILEN